MLLYPSYWYIQASSPRPAFPYSSAKHLGLHSHSDTLMGFGPTNFNVTYLTIASNGNLTAILPSAKAYFTYIFTFVTNRSLPVHRSPLSSTTNRLGYKTNTTRGGPADCTADRIIEPRNCGEEGYIHTRGDGLGDRWIV